MIQTHTLDNNNYSKMASLDLSAPFNVVNIDLLIKRLVIGLPEDLIELIQIWLRTDCFQVSSRLYFTQLNPALFKGQFLALLYTQCVQHYFLIQQMIILSKLVKYKTQTRNNNNLVKKVQTKCKLTKTEVYKKHKKMVEIFLTGMDFSCFCISMPHISNIQ